MSDTDKQLDLIVDDNRELAQFDPKGFRLRQAAYDYGIEDAKRIKDWEMLEKAVDDKIKEQRKFVSWRRRIIRRTGPIAKESVTGPLPIDEMKLSDEEITNITGIAKMQAQRMASRLAMPEAYRLRLLGAEYIAAFLENPHVRGTFGGGENEWFTPTDHIELARAVLGEFDLDPATHEEAQKVIRAKEYFTKENDGLKYEWHGRVWLNPPYAQPLIDHFVNKMCDEREIGHISSGIMLTHNYTDTSWFHRAANVTNAMCFTRGRVKFYNSLTGGIAAPSQGQVFFYFGDDISGFIERFRTIGFVVVPVFLDEE